MFVKKFICSFRRVVPPARSGVDVLDNGRVPRLVIDFPLCCGLASWGYATILVPEGAAGVDGGITTFQNPPPPKKVSLFPWAVGIGVEYGVGDRALSPGSTSGRLST